MSRKRAADGSMVMGEHCKKMETKYASLKEDYKELQRDTRALKKRVKRATLKKNNLLAEVRFLRRKYKMLKGQGSDQLVALVGTYKGSPHACSIENGIKSPREATSTEEEHVTCECTGLESSSPSDDSYATEINGSQPLAMRGIPEVSLSQKLSITPHVESAKKKARLVCNGLVSALKSSRVKDDQIKLIPPTVAGRRTISWEDEFW